MAAGKVTVRETWRGPLRMLSALLIPFHARPQGRMASHVRAWYRDWLLLGSALVALALDQVSKTLVRIGMDPFEVTPLLGPIDLHYVTNSGSAFGLFQGQTTFLTLASLVAIGALAFFYRSHPTLPQLLRFALGLVLGGALGNLTDRLLLGEVTDFLAVGWWPRFNVADSAIVVGMAMVGLEVMVRGHTRETTVEQPGEEEATVVAQTVFTWEDLQRESSSSCADGDLPSSGSETFP